MTDPDLRTQLNDDRLLDRIGRGERLRTHDDVAAMLSAWRLELPAAGPPDPRLIDAVTGPSRRRARRRAARTSVSIAASVAVLSGGIMVAAAYANPDSPLWPVARIVYGDLAESRIALDNANQAVAEARTAVDQGRYADALRLLAAAGDLAEQVDDPVAADRLHEDIAKVRRTLPPDKRSEQGPAGRPTESLGVAPPPLDPGKNPKVAPRNGPPANGKPHQPGDGNKGAPGGNHGPGPEGNNGNGSTGDNDDDQGSDDDDGPPAPAEPGKSHTKKGHKPRGHANVIEPTDPATASPTAPATEPQP